MRVFIFLVFVSLTINSQTILFKGKIIDENSVKPVAYANISFVNKPKGISSEENGTFSLEINKKLLQEKIHISCLNYKDTIVLASSVQGKVIKLKPERIELEEIVVSKKVSRELIVDLYKRRDIKSGFGARQRNPWIVTKFFKYDDSYINTPYLKNITVHLSTSRKRKSKFRIRFYKIDSVTGNPSEDLVKESIIAYSEKGDKKVKLDLTKYNIEFPREGFFIGLERLYIPYNFYEYMYTKEGNKKKYIAKAVAPNFGAVYSEDTMRLFTNGRWLKSGVSRKFHKGNSIQPAISLTLSN